ncbi:hypothetical protein [Oligoflexus tunisiensis]|uniref:hypothetical protein n=1 Tax=Oligoflexus tunisiensis TaxID=708132 RepID=UPI00114D0493|nr:hypothetical protein [Oligoflexus tunisiensis]
MSDRKTVSLNVEQIKDRVSSKARSVLEDAKDRVQEARERINNKAVEVKEQALLGTIDKGIAILQKAKNTLK